VATLDMTWIPTLAANGALEDLSTISGGQLNGTPIALPLRCLQNRVLFDRRAFRNAQLVRCASRTWSFLRRLTALWISILWYSH
jgi:hypothetical protein